MLAPSTLVLLIVLAAGSGAPNHAFTTAPQSAVQQGDTESAGEARREPALASSLSDGDREALKLLHRVFGQEGRDAARQLLAELVERFGEPEAGAEGSHVAYLMELDGLAKELGSLPQSLRLRERVLAIQSQLLAPDHPDLLAAKENLGATRYALGDVLGAREIFDAVLEARGRLLPEDDPDLLAAKQNLAATRRALGDLNGARELYEAVLESRVRVLPEHDPDLLAAKHNLAATMYALGDLAGACELLEDVLETYTRVLPEDHPDLLAAKQGVAATRYALGDIAGASELFEAVFEAYSRIFPADHPDLIAAQQNVAGTRYALGDLAGARELLEAVLESRARRLSADHADVLAAKQNLAVIRNKLGDLAGARELEEAVLEARSRLLPPEHPDLNAAKLNLAVTRGALGDLAGALELEEAVLEVRSRLLPADHPDVLGAKLNLAGTRKEFGDLAGARELEEAVLDAYSRFLPADHPDLLTVMLNLAETKYALGDLGGARELGEAVLEARTRLLPADHPDLLAAKLNVAGTKKKLGDLAGARELEEAVLEARTRLLPEDHPDLLAAKQGVAETRYALGDLAGAQELEEDVLEARSRFLPEDHPHLLDAKQNLAVTRRALGDLAGAQELEEDVLEARSRFLPADHPDLLAAKLNLAVSRKEFGDLAGARELEESVFEAFSRFLPEDHPDVLAAKLNLAGTRKEFGDLAGAQELEESVLEAFSRLLPEDHPNLLRAKQSLAVTRRELGDVQGARELEEAVLEARTRLLPQDHPDLLDARQNLAVTRALLGDLAGARELEEGVLEARSRLLPADHPDLLDARQNLAATRRAIGDVAGARTLVASQFDGLRVQGRALRAEATRPAREGARAGLQRFFAALSLGRAASSEFGLEAEAFATLEGLRLASVASAEGAHAIAEYPELVGLARQAAEARKSLNDLAAAIGMDEATVEGWRRDLLAASEARDRAEGNLRRRLAESGAFVGEIDARSVAARLAPGGAVASFLRFPRYTKRDFETRERPPSEDSLLAFVVLPDATVRRVELGPAVELESLVSDWRASLGRPIEGRGIGVADAASDAERLEMLGVRLRERILDPIRDRVSDISCMHVVLDDILHLVPLDALPLDGGLVGERIRIRNEVTLARLVRARREVAIEGGLAVAGSIDYEAELGTEALVRLDVATPPAEPDTRSGSLGDFLPLPETGGELASIAALYETAFEREPRVLSGSAATKAALYAAAPSARWLHLATHGWFASERFKSQLDSLVEESSRGAFERAEATLTGFAPETLCGLALAGANRGKDALGRVPGILTAEELAAFDLRNCELAVLSACETNVGLRRAGQGIQSLQTALHAAGARTAITSLWRVDDAATRRLFELFYTKLWQEGLGKADALWQAKMALRAEGYPLRDWAAWVLSGDPE